MITDQSRTKVPRRSSIYDEASYRALEAARLLKLNGSTVRAWCFGQGYRYRGSSKTFQAVIEPADAKERLLSFSNLCELHVLGAITRGHRVPLQRYGARLNMFASKRARRALCLMRISEPTASISFWTTQVNW